MKLSFCLFVSTFSTISTIFCNLLLVLYNVKGFMLILFTSNLLNLLILRQCLFLQVFLLNHLFTYTLCVMLIRRKSHFTFILFISSNSLALYIPNAMTPASSVSLYDELNPKIILLLHHNYNFLLL